MSAGRPELSPGRARRSQRLTRVDLDELLDEHVAATLARLDERRHGCSARLEVSREGGQWVAQVIADPLCKPVAAGGASPADAIRSLTLALGRIDWRRVRR